MNPANAVASGVAVLSRGDVRRLLSMEECIAAVEHAFRLYGQGTVPKPGVLATHVDGGGFHVKAGVLPFDGRWYYAAKANANFPQNRPKHGLPTIQGAILLFDAECGVPLAIMDSVEITGLRTGAATAVAAKYLARPDSRTLAIVGCGVQARHQIAAIRAVLPIEHILAYDTDGAQMRSLVAETQTGAAIEAAGSLQDATTPADVIVTCTTAGSAFLTPEHVRPGTFIAAVGADNEDKQELSASLLQSSRVIADVLQQAAQIGDLHHALEQHVLDLASVPGDLGDVLAGRIQGRTSAAEITIFDSTGMSLQDVAAACAVYRRALAEGHLSTVPMDR
ncbi:MAG TPA: ornithine cyclodeaminase family protein [Terriglobales bacterium]|nr:ornithine cyclodeaminase family protein [Terriglobales bacterium]